MIGRAAHEVYKEEADLTLGEKIINVMNAIFAIVD